MAWVDEAGNELGNRRLSGACRPREGDDLSGTRCQIDAFEGGSTRFIGK